MFTHRGLLSSTTTPTTIIYFVANAAITPWVKDVVEMILASNYCAVYVRATILTLNTAAAGEARRSRHLLTQGFSLLRVF